MIEALNRHTFDERYTFPTAWSSAGDWILFSAAAGDSANRAGSGADHFQHRASPLHDRRTPPRWAYPPIRYCSSSAANSRAWSDFVSRRDCVNPGYCPLAASQLRAGPWRARAGQENRGNHGQPCVCSSVMGVHHHARTTPSGVMAQTGI